MGEGSASQVLRYWRAVELFDPPNLPRPTKPSERKPKTTLVQDYTLRPDEPLPPMPWQEGHPLRYERLDPEKETWRHTVFGGIFPLDALRKSLAEQFGGVDEDFAGRRRSDSTAVFAMTVTDEGLLLEDTTVFSACAWATGQIRAPGPAAPGWLDGFHTVEEECRDAAVRLSSRHISYGTRSRSDPAPLDAENSTGWHRLIREILGAAAESAVGALLGELTGTIGAFAGAVVTGAAKPVTKRITDRISGESGTPTQSSAAEQDTPEASETPQPHSRELGPADLVAFAAHLADVCGVGDLASAFRLRIRSELVRRKRDGSWPDADPAFLNSLLPEDLARVIAAAPDGYGPALAMYLSERDALRPDARIDVRSRPLSVLRGVAPDEFPPGRWPSDTDRPLVTSQQFAVNRITAELMDGGGIFSVNGPPGTGKTTLLRDLIAAVVVERATRLAKLPTPRDAFPETDVHRWNEDGRARRVHGLAPGLTGFEIVVASSNNAAVENITAELPSPKELGEEWWKEAAYFGEQATALLGMPAWGAIAAPLGNSEKRNSFVQRFWWGDRAASGTGMQYLLQNVEKGGDLYDPPVSQRLSESSDDDAAQAPASTEWKKAVERFSSALDEEARLRDQCTEAWEALTAQPERENDVMTAEQSFVSHHEALRNDFTQTEEAAAHANALTESVRVLHETLAGHQAARPGGIRGFLGIGRAIREWRDQGNCLRSRLDQAQRDLVTAQSRYALATERLRAGQHATDLARERAQLTRDAQRHGQDVIDQAAVALGDAFPRNWLERTDEWRELASPWHSEAWTRARSRVFLAALDLHRAFVVGTADIVRRNLGALMKTLKREEGAPPPDAEKAAWRTLFLVVPVISTTFASCGRLFGSLGKESLGWVLVDEAGQASPQAAVGALWRARRAVLVGDPLQLEPIIQLPGPVQEQLRLYHGVDLEWLPERTSAQRLADRANRWGTEVDWRDKDGEVEQVWVGAPLRVHRRCDQPMFQVSNEIAYGGMMVFGTGEPKSFLPDGRGYARSSWINVEPDEVEGKWIPREGYALVRALEKLRRHAVNLDQIRVLSPFREVVESCRRFVGTELEPDGLTGGGEAFRAFIKDHIGTVHTMQGKEADVVFLVLGTHPERHKSARAWAARPPNLLNVAVTRAKRRLFVIGNRDAWREQTPYRILSDAFSYHDFDPL